MDNDEITYSEYRTAAAKIEICGRALMECDPDEAAAHWLPELTFATAIVFSFIGDNMTARHLPGYARTVADLQAAKSGTLPKTH